MQRVSGVDFEDAKDWGGGKIENQQQKSSGHGVVGVQNVGR